MNMLEPLSPFSGWHDYYVIIGSSAAALTGLNFVVVALSAEAHTEAAPQAFSAFATPTVVHFGAVLLIAALVTAPWPTPGGAAWGLAVCGVAGLVYTGYIVRHARRQTAYKPVAEDWIWHVALPFASYAALAVGGSIAPGGSVWPMFVIGAAALMLMYIGIHNAWDSATYLAQRKTGTNAQ